METNIMSHKIICVFLVLLQVTGTSAVIWTAIPGYSVINPDGSPLLDRELQVAVSSIVHVRHEYCFDQLRPGHPKFRVFNNKTDCSTLIENIVDDQVVVFDESCVTLKPKRDHTRVCFSQNKPGAELMKIGNRIWLICGPEDLIETVNWKGICSRKVIPYDTVLKINNKPTMVSKGPIRIQPTTTTPRPTTPNRPISTTFRPVTIPTRVTTTTPRLLEITSRTSHLATTVRPVTTPSTTTTSTTTTTTSTTTTPRPTTVVQTTTVSPTDIIKKTPTMKKMSQPTEQSTVSTAKPNNIFIRNIDNMWKQENMDFILPTIAPTPTMTTPEPELFEEKDDWNLETPIKELNNQGFMTWIWTVLWIVAAGIVIKCFSGCIWWLIKRQLDKLWPYIEMYMIRLISRNRPLIENTPQDEV